MSENQVCPLEQLVLHEIAKKLRQFLLRQASEPSEYTGLIHCEDEIIQLLPIGVNKLLREKLMDAMVSLQIGYNEAISWAFKHSSILPFSIFLPGQYEAINYINPFEHFEDLSWAKLFVLDENQPICNRFVFACLYCFEEMISSLWQEMKANNQLPCEGDLEKINDQFGNYIGLWAYHLEDKIEEVVVHGFYVDGFTIVYNLHEHAAPFFWRHCSAEEKANILPTLDLRETHNVRLSFFLYSLLFIEHKNSLITWIADERLNTCTLASLLCSRFGKVILKDLLSILDSISSQCFENILVSVAYCKYRTLTPAYKKVFKILWNYRLSQREPTEILELNYLLFDLMISKNIDLLEIVILPLPHSVKEKILLDSWRMIGRLMIEDLFNSGNCDILCCILLLLLKYDPDKRQLTIRVNAINLLDRFIGCNVFFACMCESQFTISGCNVFFACMCKSQFTISGVQKIGKIMQHFRETLSIINQLVNHSKREITNHAEDYLDFLSKKIYPLLRREVKSFE